MLMALAFGSTAYCAPLEAYGRLPTLEDVAVSPDGEHLAYVTAANEKRVVVIRSIADSKLVDALNVSTEKLRDLTWADGQHLLITISRTTTIANMMGPRQEYFMTLSYDLAARKMRNLLERVPNALNIVSGAPQPRTIDGHTVVFVSGVYVDGRQSGLALFGADLTTGRTKIVQTGADGAMHWVVDAQGNVVAETDYVESTQHWSLRLKKNGRWAEALGETTPINFPEVMGIGPDGKALIIRSAPEEKTEMKAMSLADGTLGPELGAQYQLTRVMEDPATHLIMGGERMTARTEYVFFEPKDQALWESIKLSFDGENVELVSWSNDRTRIVVRVAGERTGVAYVLVDLKDRKKLLIGNAYEDIKPADVAPVKPISYEAQDGLKIQAYLTVPKGRDAKNLPLVVLVHGGPAARDRPGFDWWSQALASQGYAVLQPEFRGSNGLTVELLNAGYGEWGRKMQSDVSDGVRSLAKQGVIDPARVCIVGASYGGYAALAGITLETGVYRCAVAVAGVSDPRGMLESIKDRQWRSSSRALRYWDRFMGVDGTKDPKLDQISPLSHAAQATAPVLLIHGRDDTVVPIDQSESMAKALQRADKAVQFIHLQSEDHWLSRSDTRLQMLQESVKFLEANNPPA